jgi:DNA repair exonuclease SbcCD nuclease subunit
MSRDIVVVHTSDVHIDAGYIPALYNGDPTGGLSAVLSLAREQRADALLLAGDTFESHRQPPAVLDRTAGIIAGAGLPVILLPGNHDPAIPEAVFRRGAFADLANLHVLGVTGETLLLPACDLEVWGRAHDDYADMEPFEIVRPRSTRWQIAMGHGHYEPAPDFTTRPRPSWLFGDRELAALQADYVALGHWNRAAQVGRGTRAFYSGSPDHAGTANVVRLAADGTVSVTRAPLTFGAR